MVTITRINTNIVEEAVYNLCVQANTLYPKELYTRLLRRYNKNKTIKNKLILKNINLAKNTARPLCQDTGQVMVFVKTGKNIVYTGKAIDTAINDAAANAYKKNYFRKSIVKNAFFDRNNTGTNVPAIIYHEFSTDEDVEINVLIKGAGAENYSNIKMFKPTDTENEIFTFIKETVEKAGEKACPPIVAGIGIGGTTDRAALLSKKAFFELLNAPDSELSHKTEAYLDSEDVLAVKVLTDSTHIASLPVAVTLNCHCTRHACAKINNNKISYIDNNYELYTPKDTLDGIKVSVEEKDKIKKLKKGDKILLSGIIYTARDAAHAKLAQMISSNEELPFEFDNEIIFYAGPCPNAPNEIIGPVGPTTSARMDKFCDMFYSRGLLATIGKGERSKEAVDAITANGGKYFTAIGGISCVLAQTVVKSEIAAFEELGAEAVFKLTVKNLPLTVVI